MEAFLNTFGFLFINMLVIATLALSVYFPLMAGQLSLASPGFYALGGYVAAIISTRILTDIPAGQPYPVTYVLLEMLIAAVLSGLLAIVIGVPALRLRGIYLALATIAFVEILRVLALNGDNIARSLGIPPTTLPGSTTEIYLTGGASGIFNIPPPFSSISKIEYMTLIGPLLILTAWFAYRLERSRVGRALIAIREDEIAASAMGIHTTYYKVLSFVLGAVVAGMVGAFNAHVLNTWNTRQGDFNFSIQILACVLIGGSRTWLGPIIGGLSLTALPEVLRQIASIAGDSQVILPDVIGPLAGVVVFPPWLTQFLREGRFILYGVLLAAGTIFFSQGAVTPDTFQNLRARWRRRVNVDTRPTGYVSGAGLSSLLGLILGIVLACAFLFMPWLHVNVNGLDLGLSGLRFLVEAEPVIKGGIPLLICVPIAALGTIYIALRALMVPRTSRNAAKGIMLAGWVSLAYFITFLLENQGARTDATGFLGAGFYVGLMATLGLVIQVLIPRITANAALPVIANNAGTQG